MELHTSLLTGSADGRRQRSPHRQRCESLGASLWRSLQSKSIATVWMTQLGLVGGWATPLKNYESQVGENRKCSKPPTRGCWFTMLYLLHMVIFHSYCTLVYQREPRFWTSFPLAIGMQVKSEHLSGTNQLSHPFLLVLAATPPQTSRKKKTHQAVWRLQCILARSHHVAGRPPLYPDAPKISSQLWPWLLVITGYFYGIIQSINGVISYKYF